MPLKIAVPKGYLLPSSIEMLKKADILHSEIDPEDRRLIYGSSQDSFSFIIARPFDVPVYVEYGAADIGIVGKDVLMEQKSIIYELADLGYGSCDFVVAQIMGSADLVRSKYERLGYLRVATKYPNVTKEYYDRIGMQVEIIKLYGSVELAPILDLAEQIVDITATGKTLNENNLEIVDRIASATARLIANQVSYKLKFKELDFVLGRIFKALSGGQA
ncbi:MAG: ATP phosphoribosyltransferase [Actinobacteria bacterium]|nr:ATP phosphoribosyltransferase [Actinomycetota bacterium]